MFTVILNGTLEDATPGMESAVTTVTIRTQDGLFIGSGEAVMVNDQLQASFSDLSNGIYHVTAETKDQNGVIVSTINDTAVIGDTTAPTQYFKPSSFTFVCS